MRERYKGPVSFLKLSSVDAIHQMMEWGSLHVDFMEERGELAPLDAFRHSR